MALGRPFDGFVEQTKRVSPTCLVHFDRNRYSVPASFANRPVSLRIYPERIAVVAEGQTLLVFVFSTSYLDRAWKRVPLRFSGERYT